MHYADIIEAKNNNFKIYDFGGISNQDKSLKGIDDFKIEFSKKIVSLKNFTIANTIRGKLALFIINLIRIYR